MGCNSWVLICRVSYGLDMRAVHEVAKQQKKMGLMGLSFQEGRLLEREATASNLHRRAQAVRPRNSALPLVEVECQKVLLCCTIGLILLPWVQIPCMALTLNPWAHILPCLMSVVSGLCVQPVHRW